VGDRVHGGVVYGLEAAGAEEPEGGATGGFIQAHEYIT
jgi:hypothetical protein